MFQSTSTPVRQARSSARVRGADGLTEGEYVGVNAGERDEVCVMVLDEDSVGLNVMGVGDTVGVTAGVDESDHGVPRNIVRDVATDTCTPTVPALSRILTIMGYPVTKYDPPSMVKVTVVTMPDSEGAPIMGVIGTRLFPLPMYILAVNAVALIVAMVADEALKVTVHVVLVPMYVFQGMWSLLRHMAVIGKSVALVRRVLHVIRTTTTATTVRADIEKAVVIGRS